MEIKIITKNEKFIDLISNDCNLIEWAENWIKDQDEYWDIEMYNGGNIYVDDNSICFYGDNGMLQLEIITKII